MAELANFNLVKVSSIFPPYCQEISKEEGLTQLNDGQIVFVVMCKINSNKLDELITASIALAKPTDPTKYGYFCEHFAYNERPEMIGEFTENLATEMLITKLGIEYDVEEFYKGNMQDFLKNNNIAETKHIIESGVIQKEGEWLTLVVAAVLLM